MGTSLHISYENIATPTDKSMPYAKGQANSKETNYVVFCISIIKLSGAPPHQCRYEEGGR